ncbi:MAG: HAMP domain-containing sensor histidine kinase, partial [Dehalococcoidia bacterium]|nr:HAMP domain-containing sensor histidine kinase [Dehalococcoidia bacterium]
LERLDPLDLDREYDSETAGVFLLVFRADGALLANPNEVEADDFAEDDLLDGALRGESAWFTVKEHGDRVRLLVAPVWHRGIVGGEIEGVVVGGRGLESYERQLQSLLLVLGSVGLGGAALALVGGYVLAGRALQPIAIAYDRQRAFVSDASHELRSPLAVIRAGTDVLLRDPLSDEQRSAVEDLRDTAVEASALVDDLLELARLERAPGAPHDARTDLAAVADGVLAQMRPLLEAHASEATRRGPSVFARTTDTDARRVLRALVENAIAHTPAGTSIEVETAEDAGHAVLRVLDRGPGVPPEALETVFDRFTRVDTARTPSGGHSGLGLAIVAGHVRANGGTIVARNRAGGGFEVEVRLPLAR